MPFKEKNDSKPKKEDRIGRRSAIRLTIVPLSLSSLVSLLCLLFPEDPPWYIILSQLALGIFSVVLFIFVLDGRLKDINSPEWVVTWGGCSYVCTMLWCIVHHENPWSWLTIPYLIILCWPGTKGPNKYGDKAVSFDGNVFHKLKTLRNLFMDME